MKRSMSNGSPLAGRRHGRGRRRRPASCRQAPKLVIFGGTVSESKTYLPRDWGIQPPYLYEGYKSTVERSPRKPLVPLPETLSELTGPVYGHDSVREIDSDLTRNGAVNGQPLGQRIVVVGRVTDENGRPVPNTLIEIWQANAAGRYVHKVDTQTRRLIPISSVRAAF